MRLWINLALLASFVLAGKLIFNSNKKNFVVFTCVWVRLSGVFDVCVHKKWCEILYIHKYIYIYESFTCAIIYVFSVKWLPCTVHRL